MVIAIPVAILIDWSLQNANTAEAMNVTASTTPQVVQLEVVIDWNRERVIEEVKRASEKYGVSYDKMYHTVACESGFDKDIQSHHTLSYGREESYGVAQFHIPSRNRNAEGEVITKEMALDPAQALDAMAYHFSQGNAKAWTCYRHIYL